MTDKLPFIDIDKALVDPELVFGDPERVAAHPGIAPEQKVAILTKWAALADDPAPIKAVLKKLG